MSFVIRFRMWFCVCCFRVFSGGRLVEGGINLDFGVMLGIFCVVIF